MKKVGAQLKLLYSQYRELQSFAQFGSDLDADTRARLAQGERIVAVLKQGRSAPLPVEKQVCILYAVVNNWLKEVPVEQVPEYEQGLYEYLDTQAPAVLAAIRDTGKMDANTEQALKDALASYGARFGGAV